VDESWKRRGIVVGGWRVEEGGMGALCRGKKVGTLQSTSRLRQKISKIYTSTLSDCLMLRG
jgi:hypothetical protein